MPGGGGGTTQTSQQVNTNMGPWSEQGPYLQQGFANAGGLLNNTDPRYYPRSTVSGFTPAQSQGYQSIIDRARAGSPLLPAANDTALKTIQGGFLDPSTNPWLKGTFDAASNDVTRAYRTATDPSTAGGFASAGRYGSGALNQARSQNQQNLGDQLGSLASTIYGGNYQAERGRQLQQTNLAPGLMQAAYIDPTAMVNAGGAQQAQQQRQLQDQVNRWNTEVNPAAKWDEQAKYQALVGGNYGQSGTQTTIGQQPAPSSNPLAQLFGGGLAAAGTAGNLGWSPFGGAGGAAAAGGKGAGAADTLMGALPAGALLI